MLSPSGRSNLENALLGGGEMGRLVSETDWSSTPLGPIESWPQSLQTAVSICLCSRFPILVWWGPEFIMIYNDAYRPVLGATKHPQALGQRGEEGWAEIWHIIGPMLEQVYYQGIATWSDDQMLPVQRYGFTEESYFTFSYSPIFDETARVGGVFTAVEETTRRVLSERRLYTLRELAEQLGKAKTVEDTCEIAAKTLALNPFDIPFALLYLTDKEGTHARLAGATGVDRGEAFSPTTIELQSADATAWPLQAIVERGEPVFIGNLSELFEAVPQGPWPETPERALILLLRSGAETHPIGFMVAGISARLAFDDDYRAFLELAARHVASALNSVTALEAERKRAEALAELDQAKTEFFSNISHEFRTPLTLILNPLRDALDQAGDLDSALHESLTVAHRNALRLQKLVNTLLDFSRIQANRLHATYMPTDLAEFTRDLASVFRSTIERVGLQLVVDCPPLPEPVYVDRDMWEKIVLNLLSNAFKFTFEGRIEVRLRPTEGAVEMIVRDTGTGIPADQLPHLFERFHRVRGAQSRTHEGSGIGLALVKELVRFHGGTIEVSSELGAGTTFEIRIPTGVSHLPPEQIVPEDATPTSLASAAAYIEEVMRWLSEDSALVSPTDSAEFAALPALQPGKNPTRVLVVDDNADMREYLRRLLRARYLVETAADGLTALEAARRNPPDLIISDVMQPGLNGFTLLHELRRNRATQTIPIILLSARTGEEARIEGLEAGADDYLIKPFSARELLARVEARLQIAQLQREKLSHEQAARLQSEEILESISDAFYALDRDWRFIYVNRRAEQLWGREHGSLTGKRIWDEFPMGASTESYHKLRQAMETQTPAQYETYSEFMNAWVEVNIYPSESGLSVYFRDVSERKRDERALIESRLLIQRIADAIPDVVYVYDFAQDRITYVNREIEFTLGYTTEEIARMPESFFEATLHPQDVAAFRARAERFTSAQGNDLIETEFRLRAATGEWRWFHSRETVFVRDEDGAPLSVVGSAQDVTERRHVEEQARLLKAINEALLEALTIEDVAEVIVSTVINTLKGNIGTLYWLTPDRQTLELLSHATLPEAFRKAFSHVPLDEESPLRDAIMSGNPVWFETMDEYITRFPLYADMVRAYKMHSAAVVPLRLRGEIRGAFTIGFAEQRTFSESDRMTLLAVAHQCGQAMERALLHEAERQARRNAEAAQMRLTFLAEASAALANSLDFRVTLEEIARRIVPTFADYTCIDLLQEDGRIERACIKHVNPAHEHLLLQASVTAPLRLDAERGAGRVIRTGKTEADNRFDDSTIEKHIHDPVHQDTLRRINVHSYIIAPLTARGRTFGAITFGSSTLNRYTEDDVRLAEELARRTALSLLNAQLYSDEQRARLRAEKADELKVQFLGMVSHELRTPLASIKGFASTLLADDVSLDAALNREFLEIIDKEADKLRDLIDQLLDLSRMEAGTLSIEPEPHTFGEVIQIASAQLAALCTEHRLIIDIAENLPRVLVDKDRIAQVLSNLVSNATKYSPLKTTITIRAYTEGRMLRVDVSDQGTGIPEEARDYIFEAFRQLDHRHSKKGAGLGLAICKGLVERHGGRIWIADNGRPGATLSFTLRLAPEQG